MSNEQSESIANPEMSVIGWLVAAGVLVLLFPVIPFLAIGWVVSRLLDSERSTSRPDTCEHTADIGVDRPKREERPAGAREPREPPLGPTEGKDARTAAETTGLDEQRA